MSRIYSPSQTVRYLECPMAWWLSRRQNIEPVQYAFMELAGCVGVAFSIFMEYLFETNVATAKQRAHQSLIERHNELMATKRTCADHAKAFESQLHTRLDRFVDAYLQLNPIPPAWKLFDAEKAFPRFGNCRVDTMARTQTGKLAIIDYKTRGRLNANQVESTRIEFSTSHQLLHYAWAAQQEYNEPVEYTAICLVALEPKAQAHFWTFPVNENLIATWSAGMKYVWADMEAVERGERTPAMSSTHSNKFGRCRYHSLCFNFSFDFSRAEHHYVQIEK